MKKLEGSASTKLLWQVFTAVSLKTPLLEGGSVQVGALRGQGCENGDS